MIAGNNLPRNSAMNKGLQPGVANFFLRICGQVFGGSVIWRLGQGARVS